MEHTSPAKDLLRISAEDRLRLAQALSRKRSAEGQASKRKAERFTMPGDSILIGEFADADGVISRYSLTPRDISRSGLSVLHGGFVHPGTRCRLTLIGANRACGIEIDAQVVRCEHVSANIHDLGFKFANELANSELIIANLVAESSAGSDHGNAILTLVEQIASSLRRNGSIESILSQFEHLEKLVKGPRPGDA